MILYPFLYLQVYWEQCCLKPPTLHWFDVKLVYLQWENELEADTVVNDGLSLLSRLGQI